MIPGLTQRRSRPRAVARPPPLKGWNARDPINAVGDGHALWLENFIPRHEGLMLREGKERWRSLSGPVLTLMSWSGMGRTPRLFAATQSTITDVTSPGGQTSAAVTGLSGGTWAHDLVVNPGGAWLICCNGANGVRRFDGTDWSTSTITGADATRFVDVAVHQRRPIFVERGSLKLHYLGVDEVQGAAKTLDLAPLCRKGGTLTAVASLTVDGGRNGNDRLIAVTSEGEMIVYQGASPHRAAEWSLVGVFNVARPVGRRCFARLAGGLAYMSRDGLMPVPAVLARAEKDQSVEALSDVIGPAYRQSVAAAPANSQAWSAVESGAHGLIVLNVPTQGGNSSQLVQSDAGGWCLFSNLAATCWGMCGDDLFFGDQSGAVWRYGGTREGPDYLASIGDGPNAIGAGPPGMGDELDAQMGLVSSPITALLVDAYSMLGARERKSLKRVRPVLDLPVAARPRIEALADHRRLPVVYTNPLTYADSRRLWDSIAWSSTPVDWEGREVSITNQWRSVGGRGHSLALVMALKALAPVSYLGAEVIYEVGGGI